MESHFEQVGPLSFQGRLIRARRHCRGHHLLLPQQPPNPRTAPVGGRISNQSKQPGSKRRIPVKARLAPEYFQVHRLKYVLGVFPPPVAAVQSPPVGVLVVLLELTPRVRVTAVTGHRKPLFLI